MPTTRRCVFGCKTIGVTLHSFPQPTKDPQRFKAWVNLTGTRLSGLTDDKIYPRKKVCDIHFGPQDRNRNNRLNTLAIPSLLLPPGILGKTSKESISAPPPTELEACDIDDPPEVCSIEDIRHSHLGTLEETSQESTSAPSPTEFEACDKDDPPEVCSPEDIRSSHLDTPAVLITVPKECINKFDLVKTVSGAVERKVTKPIPIKTYGSRVVKPRPVKQVLQLRLIDDVSVCDEPLYEVLTDDETDKEVNKKQTATQTDVQSTASSVNISPSKEIDVQCEPIAIPDERTAPTCERFTKKDYWKLKLKHILHNTQFCGVCLETDVDMNALSHVFEITDDERIWSTSLADIVHKIFREDGYWPANSQICNNCTNKLIQSYIFIRNAEETSRMLERHLNELYTKTCYVRNNSLENANNAHPRIYNVVIALDNKVISQNLESEEIKIETPEPVQSERGQIDDKRKLRCVSCNVVVRSYRAWRRHERTAHKQSVRCRICLQSYKTQRALTTHYKTHLRSRCPFCHRTVRDGALLQHLKTRHKHSIHACATCNVALFSAEALRTHIEECHRREGSKCVTCLQSLSRVELERHQCRFKCPECEELPCVHLRHLMRYREQMDLAPRAKCADCRYVASSKQALLAHVNATHLSHQSLRCARCGQNFYRRAHLDKHVCVSGRGNRPYHECRYCEKAFSNLYTGKRHEKHCKGIQRKYQCDDCPANFDSYRTYFSQDFT